MNTGKNVIGVDDASFDREVLQGELPVLVEFFAPWCGPCKTLAPIVERVAAEAAGRLKVVAIDISASPETLRRYAIRGAPTLLVFRNGQKIAQHRGATTRERLLQIIAS